MLKEQQIVKKRLIIVIALLALLTFGYKKKIENTLYDSMHWQAALYLQISSLRYRVFGAPPMMSQASKDSAHSEQRFLLQSMRTSMQSITNLHIPGKYGTIPLRVYRPTAEVGLPLVLNVHGGAFILGSDFVDEAAITHFASVADSIVISIDYRLAPQHPYPVALDEVTTALQWLGNNAHTLGGDSKKLAIMGSSAGANIAAALTLRNRDLPNSVPLLFQYLSCPLLDLQGNHTGASYQSYNGLLLSEAGNQLMFDAYAPAPIDRKAALVSPVYARSFAGLPPAYIALAELDPLHDQGVYYGKGLERAGVNVITKTYTKAIHGFTGTPHIYQQSNLDAAKMLKDILAKQ